MSKSNIIANVTIHSPFSSQLIMSNFSMMIVFCKFFTGTTLGDVDIYFLLMLVRKSNAVEGEII
jgi:hypothetical protein